MRPGEPDNIPIDSTKLVLAVCSGRLMGFGRPLSLSRILPVVHSIEAMVTSERKEVQVFICRFAHR